MTVIALLTIEHTVTHSPDGTVPDELTFVRGEACLTHAVRGLTDSGYVDLTIVLASDRRLAERESAVLAVSGIAGRYRFSVSGADRSESFSDALRVVGQEPCEVLLVHQAQRALTPPELVTAVVDAVRDGAEAAVPVLPMTDTVKVADPDGVIIGTHDRARLRTGQTPMAFRGELLPELIAAGGVGPVLARLGERVRLIDGHPHAMPLLTPFDLAVAEAAFARPAGGVS